MTVYFMSALGHRVRERYRLLAEPSLIGKVTPIPRLFPSLWHMVRVSRRAARMAAHTKRQNKLETKQRKG